MKKVWKFVAGVEKLAQKSSDDKKTSGGHIRRKLRMGTGKETIQICHASPWFHPPSYHALPEYPAPSGESESEPLMYLWAIYPLPPEGRA